MRYGFIARLAADLCLLVLVGWAPWWIALLALAAFSWLFAPYYEGLVAGIAYDALYGASSFRASIAAFAIFAAAAILKKRTRI